MKLTFNKLSRQMQDLPDKVASEHWSELPKASDLTSSWQALKPARRHHWLAESLGLVTALAAPFLVGAIGGLATERSIKKGWYKKLAKPTWTPPAKIFGPVWTVLYLMMGIASWLVWQRGEDQRRKRWLSWFGRSSQPPVTNTLQLYGVHLVLNMLWSIFFFGLRRVDLALANIVVLWGSILATLVRFYQIHPLAGWLLVPYQLWVTFAAILNGTIWWLNRKKQ